MNARDRRFVGTPDADLRETPRHAGLVLARIGERVELLGLRLQDAAAELQYRKWRAMSRWGT